MGMQVTGSGGPQRGRRGQYKPLAEINVTPFVDVMLVLLIVFMVAAPLLTAGVSVELPKAQANPLPQDNRPLEITIDQNGTIFVADTEAKAESIEEMLRAIAGENKETRIYVRGDRRNDYGRVMEVIGIINAAGYRKVALVSDPDS